MADFHFEQSKNFRGKDQKSTDQLRTESIERKFTGKTDRNLLEEQTYLINTNSKNIASIQSMITFFVWLAGIGILAWFILTLITLEVL